MSRLDDERRIGEFAEKAAMDVDTILTELHISSGEAITNPTILIPVLRAYTRGMLAQRENPDINVGQGEEAARFREHVSYQLALRRIKNRPNLHPQTPQS